MGWWRDGQAGQPCPPSILWEGARLRPVGTCAVLSLHLWSMALLSTVHLLHTALLGHRGYKVKGVGIKQ